MIDFESFLLFNTPSTSYIANRNYLPYDIFAQQQTEHCFLSRSQTKKEREVLRRVTSRFFVRSSSTSTIHILPSRTRVSGRAAKSPQQASSLTPLPGVYATLPPRRSKASRTTPTIRQNSATGTLTTKPVNKGKNGVFQVHAVH
jgi:hypothetical protein